MPAGTAAGTRTRTPDPWVEGERASGTVATDAAQTEAEKDRGPEASASHVSCSGFRHETLSNMPGNWKDF